MKTMRKLLAMVLALMLMTGTFGTALADEPVGFGDLESLQVEGHTDLEGEMDPFVLITAEKEDGTIEQINLDQDGCSVTAGDITKEAVKEETVEEGSTGDGPDSQENGDLVQEEDRPNDGDLGTGEDNPGEPVGDRPSWALYVYSDNAEVNVETGDAKQENDSTPAVFVYSEGEGADITVKTDNVSSETTALEVVNVGGMIDATVESIEAKGTGISVYPGFVEESLGENEEEIEEEEFLQFLEEAGDNAVLVSSHEFDNDKIMIYKQSDSYKAYFARYEFRNGEYHPYYFCTYELEHNDGDSNKAPHEQGDLYICLFLLFSLRIMDKQFPRD